MVPARAAPPQLANQRRRRSGLPCAAATTADGDEEEEEEEPAVNDVGQIVGGYTPANFITYHEGNVAPYTQSVTINAPPSVCFEFWNDWNRLVDFLDLVAQVRGALLLLLLLVQVIGGRRPVQARSWPHMSVGCCPCRSAWTPGRRTWRSSSAFTDTVRLGIIVEGGSTLCLCGAVALGAINDDVK